MSRAKPGPSFGERTGWIYALSSAYADLVDSDAPPDITIGVAFWLRKATREGMTDDDLEHVLNALGATPLTKKGP
jgi:hypothetical protein